MRRTILFTILASSLFLNTASAQVCPGFPARGVEIIDRLFNPGLAFGDDDQRRALTRTYIEQLVFEFPFDGWTWKSADGGRPPSKDSIARNVNGRLCNWDWQNGTTRQRAVQAGQPGDDITGQNPIPVPGVNHLSVVPQPQPNPQPQPQPVPEPVNLQPIIDYMRLLDAARTAQIERMFADLTARDDEKRKLILQVDEHVVLHAKETHGLIEKVGSFFTNGKTLAVIAGLVAGRFAIPQD